MGEVGAWLQHLVRAGALPGSNTGPEAAALQASAPARLPPRHVCCQALYDMHSGEAWSECCSHEPMCAL